MIAVHPQHGVVWTDGKAIYLAPIQVQGDQVQNATSVKLGEFENVVSIHWSCVRGTEACFMCVVHHQNVTVWRASGGLPKLAFKQVRKINVKAIPQGCLWNPCSDLLCLLSRQQCSFYFRHDGNKGSYAFPLLESGKITCGCWSTDGLKLVLCVGSVLLIYKWSKLDSSANEFTASAWRVPGLDGQITSISPVLKNSIVMTTEISLENMCKQQQDAFIFPLSNKNGTNSHGDIIGPNGNNSATQSLLNLPLSPQALTEASSGLTLVQINEEGDPNILSSVALKGVLSPDILLYERSSQCVVVGSNSQSQLHIYALLDKRLAYCGDIQLEKGQRPKGLCSMPTYFDEKGAALLILVGQRSSDDASFISTSSDSEFHLSLKYIILKAGYDKSRHKIEGSRNKQASRNSGIVKSESMKEHRVKQLSEPRIRGRSGSIKNDNKSRVSSSHIKLPSMSPTEEESPLDVISLLPNQPELSSSKMIEDMSDSSDAPSQTLETEKTQFNSEAASFLNQKLQQKYDLDRNKSPPDFNKSKTNTEVDTQIIKSKSLDSNHHDLNSERKSLFKAITVDCESNDFKTDCEQYSSNDRESRALNGDIQPKQEHVSNLVNCHNNLSKTPNRQSSSQRKLERAQKINFEDQLDNFSSVVDKNQKSGESSFNADETKRNSNDARFPLPHVDENDFDKLCDELKQEISSSSGMGSLALSENNNCIEGLEKQLQLQRDTIETIQRRLEELSESVRESSCVFPVKYQNVDKPEIVEIQYKSTDGNSNKKFLLDNGRLQLEQIKLTFGLSTVELWMDGISCVLGANIDGYVPIRFEAGSTLHITGISGGRQT